LPGAIFLAGCPLTPPTAEHARLADPAAWRRWGPYLSERQWGTVREDYSAGGDAWHYLPHEHARSRAYRWGEDGLAGFCDERQRLCLALVVWNGHDPILKERLFGLTNGQGNHGEDVKELYFYLDATPTHSYLKMLYKYPQAAFPYEWLIRENAIRGRGEPEFEITDTGVFAADQYFDVFVEYAKAEPDDLLMLVTAFNRGPEPAELHLLPHLWFRNTWTWREGAARPGLAAGEPAVVHLAHPTAGRLTAQFDGQPTLLFCDNETNSQQLFHSPGPAFPKDAIHRCVVDGVRDAVSPDRAGTKCAAHYHFTIAPGEARKVRLRLAPGATPPSLAEFDALVQRRRAEADEFYAFLQHELADADARQVQRQAFAGMIWSKQFYHYDVQKWLRGDPAEPAPPDARRHGRNCEWTHVKTAEILSMPDTWEYPWFAAWDLAFHMIPFALIDPQFAKDQLIVLLREWYMHPNGQLAAYEWNFGDVNPPVHAWAAWRVFQIDRKARGDCGDVAFLERVFHKLLLNFTWWVNRKDAYGRNIFQGGFLGLDNIGVFDRSQPLPGGAYINQADGTSWMAMYCLNLMRIALELALHNPAYQDVATKFFEHFLGIAEAMTNVGGDGQGVGLWDEEDKFYYDELNLSDGTLIRLRVRSIVGLIPLFAVETIEPETLAKLPEFAGRLHWLLTHRPDLAKLVSRWEDPGRGERRLLSLLRGHRMKRLLARMLDESEFLSDFGVRSLSKHHQQNPFSLRCGGGVHSVAYVPGESDSGMFGGNSNWRGPVWFPVNYLIIESLQKFHHYYGEDFTVECPTGSGRFVTINDVANELTRRLTRLYLRGADGRRPALGDDPKAQLDPHFRDYMPFFEYFHGDTGRGLGASHQTGWTGLIAKLLQPRKAERGSEFRS